MCLFGNDISVSVFVLQKPVFVFKQLRKTVVISKFLQLNNSIYILRHK